MLNKETNMYDTLSYDFFPRFIFIPRLKYPNHLTFTLIWFTYHAEGEWSKQTRDRKVENAGTKCVIVEEEDYLLGKLETNRP